MAKFQVEFECCAPRGECIYKESRNVCIDPEAEQLVCHNLRMVRK